MRVAAFRSLPPRTSPTASTLLPQALNRRATRFAALRLQSLPGAISGLRMHPDRSAAAHSCPRARSSSCASCSGRSGTRTPWPCWTSSMHRSASPMWVPSQQALARPPRSTGTRGQSRLQHPLPQRRQRGRAGPGALGQVARLDIRDGQFRPGSRGCAAGRGRPRSPAGARLRPPSRTEPPGRSWRPVLTRQRSDSPCGRTSHAGPTQQPRRR